jgi:hypothetical protein
VLRGRVVCAHGGVQVSFVGLTEEAAREQAEKEGYKDKLAVVKTSFKANSKARCDSPAARGWSRCKPVSVRSGRCDTLPPWCCLACLDESCCAASSLFLSCQSVVLLQLLAGLVLFGLLETRSATWIWCTPPLVLSRHSVVSPSRWYTA